jgi:predicted nucleic acid-binding protein
MRFWDSSALVPLVLEEPASEACRKLLREDGGMVCWRLTPVEVMSAVRRRERDGDLDAGQVATATTRLAMLRSSWVEVLAFEAVADRAIRILAVHRLTAADALQLAAAVEVAGNQPELSSFVTRDRRLADEASRAGFVVIQPSAEG